MGQSLSPISNALRNVLVLAALGVALATASSSGLSAQTPAPLPYIVGTGYLDCGGLNEEPCDGSTGFFESNGGACDRGLKEENNKCVNNTRRVKLNPGSDVSVGQNFAKGWNGRALRMQRQDLNWETSIGRLSEIVAHNGFNNVADGYLPQLANQLYSSTELLDAGVRVFEWDVHHDVGSSPLGIDTGAVPELCHGETHHEGCVAGDRDFFNILKELRDWMIEPGHENAVVMINLEYRVDEIGSQQVNELDGDFLVTNAIARYLERPDIGVLTEGELTAYMNAHPAAEKIGSMRREWPSQKWLVENGNRVIILGSPTRSPYFVDLPYNYYGDSTKPPFFEIGGRSGSSYPNSQIDQWVGFGSGYPDCRMEVTAGDQGGFIKYLRPESAVFYEVQSDDWIGGALSITPGLVEGATNCNIDYISFDNILVDMGRMQAAVWSWEINEPPVNAAAGRAARMNRATGRWWSTSPLDQRPFLCRKETRETIANVVNVENLPVVEFAVSSAAGVFIEGDEACAAVGTGWQFRPPLNAYENLDAKATVAHLASDPYINFHSKGNDQWRVFDDAPQLEITAPATVAEGETNTITVTLAPSWTLTEKSCGEGAELISTAIIHSPTLESWTLLCRYLGGPERDVVASFTATHPAGSIERSAVVRVRNVPPMIGFIENQTVIAGVPVFVNVELSDVADDSLGLRVDFDDHDNRMQFQLSPGTYSFHHTYTTPGTYTLLVVATDDASRFERVATITVVQTPQIPTITPIVNPPAPNANGWYTGPVTVQWSVTGSQSIMSKTGCDPVTVSQDALVVEVTCRVVYGPGLEASEKVSFSLDTTPPQVQFGTPTSDIAPSNGWYRSNVTMTYVAGDNVSGVHFTAAEGTVTWTQDGTNVRKFVTVSDLAGNSTTVETPAISIDRVPPTIVARRDRQPNADNWYNADVAVTFECEDWQSGVASCTDPVTIATEGNGSATGVAIDRAGNRREVTESGIRIDKTAPTVNFTSRSAMPNANGWNNTAVAVFFTVTDNTGSGVAAVLPQSTYLAFVSDGKDMTKTVEVRDRAGNSVRVDSPKISIDRVAPVVTGHPRTAPNANGWYNASVTIDFSCTDDLSTVASCASPQTVSSEGLNQSVAGAATDLAGNPAEHTVGGINLDRTPPVVTVPAAITLTAIGAAGAPVTFTATASDNLTGSLAPSCSPASGSIFALGSTPVTCSTADAAGNTGSATFTVTIEEAATPGRMHGDGFIKTGDARYEFSFKVSERASGVERGSFKLTVKKDRFVAQDVTFVAFSDDPTTRPGRNRRPQVDTVRFSGIGTWNGVTGYAFDVAAADEGEPGRHRESVTIMVRSPAGAVVAQVAGELSGGNVQSRRIHR